MDSVSSPRIVGRYALFDIIAAGGMASVHLGRLMGPVGFSRTVAIKRLHANYASDPEFVAMFLDEARLVARIRHPNVVPTLDVVALEQELLLVMEYVAGVPLSVLVKRSRDLGELAPIPVVVDVLVNVLSGLHAAHDAVGEDGRALNIVHRDVSPQNVLVGADGVTRVLDFGVAKAVGRMHQTRDGKLKGKLRYMAPEYLLGQEIGRVSDVYSAAVVLWEALTGRRPFSGDDDARVMYQVLEGKIPPPSRFRSEIPSKLDDVVMRGLCKESNLRFRTAKEFAAVLEEAVPPIRRRTVSEWVVRIASDYLVQRQESVAQVEASATPHRKPSSPAPTSLQAAERQSESGTTLRRVSASSKPSPPTDKQTGRRARNPAIAAGVAVLAMLAASTGLVLGQEDSQSALRLEQHGLFPNLRAGETEKIRTALLKWRLGLSSVIPEPHLSLPSTPTSAKKENPKPVVRRKARRAPAKQAKQPTERIYTRE